MSEAQQDANAASDAVQPTIADEVTDPSMAPVTEDASGKVEAGDDDAQATEEKFATQLGDFA